MIFLRLLVPYICNIPRHLICWYRANIRQSIGTPFKHKKEPRRSDGITTQYTETPRLAWLTNPINKGAPEAVKQ